MIHANTVFYFFQIKHPDVIHSYIVYIKDQWDLEPGVCDMEELRLCALIKTNKGFVNPSLEPVHFTVEYGNEVNLEKEFPSKLCLLNNNHACIVSIVNDRKPLLTPGALN